jgi:poly(3-hydroxyalkanoate) synthetase
MNIARLRELRLVKEAADRAMEIATARVPARQPGGGNLPVIEDAPGSYVRVRAVAT